MEILIGVIIGSLIGAFLYKLANKPSPVVEKDNKEQVIAELEARIKFLERCQINPATVVSMEIYKETIDDKDDMIRQMSARIQDLLAEYGKTSEKLQKVEGKQKSEQ